MTNHDAELALLLSMSKEERDVTILAEAVQQEESWYDIVTEEWRQDRSLVVERKQQAERVRYWKQRLNAAKAKLARSEQNTKQSQS